MIDDEGVHRKGITLVYTGHRKGLIEDLMPEDTFASDEPIDSGCEVLVETD
jgi:hypothetical protein